MTASAVIFTDGFDKYGPIGTGAGSAGPLINPLFAFMANEWTSLVTSSSVIVASIVAPLSTAGQAIAFVNAAAVNNKLTKNIPSLPARIVGGFRFSLTTNTTTSSRVMIQWSDTAGNVQAAIGTNPTNNIVLFSAGGSTVLATSSAAVVMGSVHYLEWDITIGSAGAYNIYLDGVSTMSGTGNFKGGTLSSYQTFSIGSPQSGGGQMNYTVDDLYIGDGTGTPLLTNPVVQTSYAVSDSAVGFTIGNAIFGAWNNTVSGSNAPGANKLFLRKFTAPSGGATLNAVSCLPAATSAGANFKAVLYSDVSGVPTTLLGSATTATTGATINTALTSALASSVALTGGTNYWIGFLTDTSVILWESDAGTTGESATSTYTSGPPGTAPTMTTGLSNWMLWGGLTATGSNTYEVSQSPTPDTLGDFSYVVSSTVGANDLFNFAALTGSPAQVHSVAVKSFVRDSDAGARTFELQVKSGGTTGNGSLAAVQPTITYEWLSSYFLTDPNTSAAWTVAAVNAMTAGYKIVS